MTNMTDKQYAEIMNFLKEMKEEQIIAQKALEKRLVKRMDQLESDIESRLLDFEKIVLLQNANTSPTPNTPTRLSGPFVHKKPHTKHKKTDAVQKLLKKVFPSLLDNEINEKYEAMGRSCLSACKGYAATGGYMRRPWRDITPVDKTVICRAVVDYLKGSGNDWSFLDECEDLWPIEYIIQPRWTNMTNKQRAKRSAREVEEEEEGEREGEGEEEDLPGFQTVNQCDIFSGTKKAKKS